MSQVLVFGGGLSAQVMGGNFENNTACMVVAVLSRSKLTMDNTTLTNNRVDTGAIYGECLLQFNPNNVQLETT